MTNSNYSTYLGTATQMQRWRDFLAHATAYATFNLLFLIIWGLGGRGTFWPAFPLAGWGIGLTFQHHANVWRGHITDEQVKAHMRAASDSHDELEGPFAAPHEWRPSETPLAGSGCGCLTAMLEDNG